MKTEPQFLARVTSCQLAEREEALIASLLDGRVLVDRSAYGLARQLRNAGIRAEEVCMPDWREGPIAPGAGQKIRLFHCLRCWEQGREPPTDAEIYGPVDPPCE